MLKKANNGINNTLWSFFYRFLLQSISTMQSLLALESIIASFEQGAEL